MMFKCDWCGRTFNELAHWKEDRGECFGYPAYETVYGCPYCKSEDVEEYDENEETEEDEEDDDE